MPQPAARLFTLSVMMLSGCSISTLGLSAGAMLTTDETATTGDPTELPPSCLEPTSGGDQGSPGDTVHIAKIQGAGDQWVTDVAIDEAGSVYVVGMYDGDLEIGEKLVPDGTAGHEIFIAKFCGASLEWLIHSEGVGDGDAIATAIAISPGPSPELYVTGSSNRSLQFENFGQLNITATPGDNAIVLRLDSQGQILNAAALDNEAEHGWAIVLTDDQHVYLAGNCEDAMGHWGILLARAGSALEELVWNCTYSKSTGNESTLGEAIDIAADGDVVVAGTYQGVLELPALDPPPDGVPNGFITKVSPDFVAGDEGVTWRWFHALGSGNETEDNARDVVVSPEGQILAAGRVGAGEVADCGTVANPGGFVAVFDPSGTCQRIQLMPPVGVVANAITADAHGDLYIAGEFRESLYVPPVSLSNPKGVSLFAFKLGPDGDPVWSFAADHSSVSSATPLTWASRIAAGPSMIGVVGKTNGKGVRLGGQIVGSGQGYDSFLVVLQP